MKKPTINYLLICEYASLSTHNKVNILGVFDDIHANGLPAKMNQIQFVSNITVYKSKKYEIEIRVLPSEKNAEPVAKFGTSLDVDDKKSKSNKIIVVGVLNNVFFPKFGEYNFNLYVDGDLLQTKMLKVLKV